MSATDGHFNIFVRKFVCQTLWTTIGFVCVFINGAWIRVVSVFLCTLYYTVASDMARRVFMNSLSSKMLSIVFCQSVGTSGNVKILKTNNIFIQLISITDNRLNKVQISDTYGR